MVNFMKVGFRVSKKNGHCLDEAVFFCFFLKHLKSLPVIILQNQRRLQLSRAVKIKIFNSKYHLFSLDLVRKLIEIKFMFS